MEINEWEGGGESNLTSSRNIIMRTGFLDREYKYVQLHEAFQDQGGRVFRVQFLAGSLRHKIPSA